MSPLLTPTSYNALLERFLEAKWNKVPVKQEEKPDKTVHLTNDPFFNDKGFGSIDKMMKEMRSEMRRGIDHQGMAQQMG